MLSTSSLWVIPVVHLAMGGQGQTHLSHAGFSFSSWTLHWVATCAPQAKPNAPTLKISQACRPGSRGTVCFLVLFQIIHLCNTMRKSGVWGFGVGYFLFLNWNIRSRTIQRAHKDSGVTADKGTVLPRGFLCLPILRASPYLRLSETQTN